VTVGGPKCDWAGLNAAVGRAKSRWHSYVSSETLYSKVHWLTINMNNVNKYNL